MQEATKRQRRVLHEIHRFSSERGYPPTHKELGRLLDIGQNAVRDHVQSLIKKDYLNRGVGVRSLRLTDKALAELGPLPYSKPAGYYLPLRPCPGCGLAIGAVHACGACARRQPWRLPEPWLPVGGQL